MSEKFLENLENPELKIPEKLFYSKPVLWVIDLGFHTHGGDMNLQETDGSGFFGSTG